jgi:hypothetical protein
MSPQKTATSLMAGSSTQSSHWFLGGALINALEESIRAIQRQTRHHEFGIPAYFMRKDRIATHSQHRAYVP